MQKEVYPIEQEYIHGVENGEDRWKTPALMHTLKQRARDAGLWRAHQ